MTFDIVNLRDAPQFFPQVADRIWRAWWEPGGTTLAELEGKLSEVAAATDFPFTLVATADDGFVGTVTAIASDLDERPDLTPWIAALWVEPDFRRTGVARKLVESATQAMFDQDHPQVYLYANAPMRAFYLGLGWTLLEESFGQYAVDIFVRHAPDRNPA
jgi:predicted N-acetyltransferase YhbS